MSTRAWVTCLRLLKLPADNIATSQLARMLVVAAHFLLLPDVCFLCVFNNHNNGELARDIIEIFCSSARGNPRGCCRKETLFPSVCLFIWLGVLSNVGWRERSCKKVMEGEMSQGKREESPSRIRKICLLIYYYFIAFVSQVLPSFKKTKTLKFHLPIVHGRDGLLHPVSRVQRFSFEGRVVHVAEHCHL